MQFLFFLIYNDLALCNFSTKLCKIGLFLNCFFVLTFMHILKEVVVILCGSKFPLVV